MRKSLMFLPAAVLALGVTGVGFAHANSSTPPAKVLVAPSAAASHADANNVDVQSGDQSGVDAPEAASAGEATGAAEATTPDTDNVQSGDQTGTDSGGAADSGN